MRERRNHLTLVGLIVAALIGVALLAVPGSPFHRSATLGLDLQGGLEVVLRAEPTQGRELTDEDLDRSVDIMRNRIDKLGVAEPELRKQGDDQIVIQLAGITDPEQAAELIGKTAQLELFDLEQDLTGPSIGAQGAVATDSLFGLLGGKGGSAPKGASAYYLFSKNGRVLEGPVGTRGELFTRKNPKVPKGGKVLGVPKGTVVVTCAPTEEQACPPDITTGGPYYYLFRYQPEDAENPIPEMTGANIKADGTRHDFDQFGQPIVTMAFTGEGEDRFQDITRRLWQRGNFRGVPQHFAIVLDREIKSWPQIDPTDRTLSDGIGGGSAQIENIGDLGEAKDLALVLQTGALPVSFEQIERTDVSATLGKDSLAEAKTAALIGLLVVALFLIIFYRLLGVVAVLGLAIYVAFMYAAILLLNVTMTLPGFAGLILTIGVAADANVVIFERIKEEVRAGKSTRAAIATGYQKGFHTIVDANVVTAITALVLFAVATAQVKGFALMLLIGTVMSVLTAVLATRAMLGLLGGFRWFDNPRFMGGAGQAIPSWARIDVCNRRPRRIWLSIATVAIVLSVLAVAVKGLNFGIDFKGGTQVTVQDTGADAAGRGAKPDGVDRARGRRRPGARRVGGRRPLHELPGAHEVAHGDAAERPRAQPREQPRRDLVEREERLVELQPPDREGRDLRRRRLLHPHHALHLAALSVALRGADPPHALLGHSHHARHLRHERARGDDGDRRRDPDRARLLDLRHDHRLRPSPREHPAHAARVVRDDRQRLAVGDDAALAGDDVHHAAADREPPALRRRDAEGLRVRAVHRHRPRRGVDVLRGDAVPHGAHGARARVPRAHRRRRDGEGRRWRRRGRRGTEAELEPAPAPERVGAPAMAAPPGDGAAPRQSKREQRRQRRRSRPHGRAR